MTFKYDPATKRGHLFCELCSTERENLPGKPSNEYDGWIGGFHYVPGHDISFDLCPDCVWRICLTMAPTT